MTAAEFAALLPRGSTRRRGKWWDGFCPAHEDRQPSLSWCDGDRRLIVKCRAGCTEEAICQAVGIPQAELYHDNGHGSRRAPRPPLTVEALAEAKGFPPEFLRGLGVEQDGDAVRITYRLEDGSLAPRQRRRLAQFLDLFKLAEAALDSVGWFWNRRISAWLDLLLVNEESA